jgi:hypothetical protein
MEIYDVEACTTAASPAIVRDAPSTGPPAATVETPFRRSRP